MEEGEYKKTYKSLNDLPCPFEKSILSNQCACENCQRLNIAERHAARCCSEPAQKNCKNFLMLLRENAKFALKLTTIPGPLTHAKEMKVQAGGLQGLQQLLHDDPQKRTVENIFGLLLTAQQRYAQLNRLPFDQIVPFIASFEGRPKRQRKK